MNGLGHQRTPLSLPRASDLEGGEAVADDLRGLSGVRPSVKRNLLTFIETAEAIRLRVRDAMAAFKRKTVTAMGVGTHRCLRLAIWCC